MRLSVFRLWLFFDFDLFSSSLGSGFGLNAKFLLLLSVDGSC